MSLPEAQHSLDQFVSMLKRITHDCAGVDQSERGGLALRWAESPFPFHNTLFLTEAIRDRDLLAERLREGATYMRQKRQRGSFYVCLDRLGDEASSRFAAVAAEAGLQQDFAARGMAMAALPDALPTTSFPEPLTFHRVLEEVGLQAFADLNCLANGFPLDAGRSAFRHARFWTDEAFTFVGFHEGEPVCCAAVTANEGSLYVSLVATHPGRQRQGFGGAVVRHALSEASRRTGITRAALHASEAGVRVYERLGFQQVARFSALILKNR